MLPSVAATALLFLSLPAKPVADGKRPVPASRSMLVCCPSGSGSFPIGWFALSWLRSLDVATDFTSSLTECNATRISAYSAVLLFESPAGALARDGWITVEWMMDEQRPPVTAKFAETFPTMLGSYVRRGGGLFLYPSEDNWKSQQLFDITSFFDLRLPLETLNETLAANTASMQHFASPIAFTDNVVKDHPITRGVNQLWYPTAIHYNAGQTAPLCLSASGQVRGYFLVFVQLFEKYVRL
eukprot:SAG31_NODE_1665_length_7585_cov_6.666711_7_plen_241_part_00